MPPASPIDFTSFSALEELDVVAHALHEALDLLIVVLGRHAFHLIALPAKFFLDDLHLFLHIPRDVGAEQDRLGLVLPQRISVL